MPSHIKTIFGNYSSTEDGIEVRDFGGINCSSRHKLQLVQGDQVIGDADIQGLSGDKLKGTVINMLERSGFKPA